MTLEFLPDAASELYAADEYYEARYVVYFIRGERVLVAAVAHGHRLPGYWRSRV